MYHDWGPPGYPNHDVCGCGCVDVWGADHPPPSPQSSFGGGRWSLGWVLDTNTSLKNLLWDLFIALFQSHIQLQWHTGSLAQRFFVWRTPGNRTPPTGGEGSFFEREFWGQNFSAIYTEKKNGQTPPRWGGVTHKALGRYSRGVPHPGGGFQLTHSPYPTFQKYLAPTPDRMICPG